MKNEGNFILLERAEFSAWLGEQCVTRSIWAVQEHHTWIPAYEQFKGSNHFALQNSMKNAHLERGFSDIAQHFSIFPDGKICTGRPLNNIPAGIKGANTGAICIENVGNFDSYKDVMEAEQRDSIIEAAAVIVKRFGITADTNGILYHHWYDLNTGERTDGSGTNKSCPGTNFFGGNSVQACNANFIPLVNEKMPTVGIENPYEGVQVIKVGRITANNLNVRSGPSSQYDVLHVLKQAVRVNCYETNGKWWRVHPTENCWIYSRYAAEI